MHGTNVQNPHLRKREGVLTLLMLAVRLNEMAPWGGCLVGPTSNFGFALSHKMTSAKDVVGRGRGWFTNVCIIFYLLKCGFTQVPSNFNLY